MVNVSVLMIGVAIPEADLVVFLLSVEMGLEQNISVHHAQIVHAKSDAVGQCPPQSERQLPRCLVPQATQAEQQLQLRLWVASAQALLDRHTQILPVIARAHLAKNVRNKERLVSALLLLALVPRTSS